MFAPISAIFALLFLVSTLPNGIRVAELPMEGDSGEIVAGYATGPTGPTWPTGPTGLSSTIAARRLELAAYAAGGTVQVFNEVGRTGLRVTAPQWARAMFTEPLTAFFKDIPKEDGNSAAATRDFRARVEDEIRSALFVPAPGDLEYTTDRAFVLMSGGIPEDLRQNLAAISRRASKDRPEPSTTRLSAERTLRFKSDLPAGAVIFAVPTPSVYYREWYSIMLLDRLIRRVVPLPVTSALALTMHPYYYRFEVPVPAGQFPEPTEENLLQEIQRLQFTPVSRMNLEAARQDARAYLEGRYAREWFESQGIPERRAEGIQWIQEMTAEDMRVAARDLLISNRVIATWPPRPRQTAVAVEDLNKGPSPSPGEGQGTSRAAGDGSQGQPLTLAPFPPHTHAAPTPALAERLASGVSLISGAGNAVFVMGGPLARFDREPDAETLKTFQSYRSDRLLVFVPPSSMDRARQLWSSFKSSNSTQTGVPKGNVATGDLSAMFILKTMLDRKLIEAGWSHDAELRISATDGALLQIRAEPEKRARILEWIKGIASEKPSDADMAWAHEVSLHRLDTVRADLQALIWERDPQGTLQDLETIGAGHVQDVARIYF